MGARLLILAMACCAPAAADRADCAPCHRAIYDSYRRTPRAASSGEAGRAAPSESLEESLAASSKLREAACCGASAFTA